MNNRFDHVENVIPSEDELQTENIDLKNKFTESINKLISKKETNTNVESKEIISNHSMDVKEKLNLQNKLYPFAEKVATIITVIDAIADPLNNYLDTKTPEKEIPPIQLNSSTQAYDYMDKSINDILSEKGYTIQENKDKGAIEIIGDMIETIGSDEDEALKSPEEIKEVIDESMKTSIYDKNNSKTEKFLPKVNDAVLAFSATATENFEYGVGGANQYFIPHANEYKERGILVKVDEIYEENDGFAVVDLQADNTNIGEENTIKYCEDESVEEYKDELDYLDKNTIDTDGLNKVLDSKGNIVNSKEEDYLHPLSNQEDSDGVYYPDAWKKSEIKDSTILFQLSTDGKSPSSYFTDSQTINSCIHNRKLNFNELREKLQVANGSDKICLSVYKCKLT